MIQSTVTHSLSGPFNSPYTYRVSMFTQCNPSRIEIGHDWLNCVSSTPPIRVDNSKRSKGKEESFLIQTYILVRNKGSYPHRTSLTVSRKCIPHQHCFQLKLYLHIRVAKHGGDARYIAAVNQGFPFWVFSFSHSFVDKMEGKAWKGRFLTWYGATVTRPMEPSPTVCLPRCTVVSILHLVPTQALN